MSQKNKQEAKKDITDIEYLETSIQTLSRVYQNAVKAIQSTNKLIKETREDRKVCKSPNVLAGIDALLKNLEQQKLKQNQDIKNIRVDLKHYTSIYKIMKRLDK